MIATKSGAFRITWGSACPQFAHTLGRSSPVEPAHDVGGLGTGFGRVIVQHVQRLVIPGDAHACAEDCIGLVGGVAGHEFFEVEDRLLLIGEHVLMVARAYDMRHARDVEVCILYASSVRL